MDSPFLHKERMVATQVNHIFPKHMVPSTSPHSLALILSVEKKSSYMYHMHIRPNKKYLCLG